MDLFRFITLKRVAKAVYGLVVAAVMAEIGLALFYRQEEALQRDLVERHPRLGFRVVPHYDGFLGKTGIPLRTNAWGFRDREYGDPPAGGLRVLVIGDSMVWGQGVHAEDTFPRYMERLLAQRATVPVEVINGGVPGYGTTQEAELLEQLFDAIKPNLVVMTVSVFNDVADELKFSEQLHRWQGERSLARRIRWFFRHNSQIYILLRRYRAAVSGQQMMDIHAVAPSERTVRGLSLIEASIRRARDFAKSREVGFLLVLNPGQTQASAKSWDEVMMRYQLDRTAFAFDQPNTRLLEFARGNGIAAFDLLDAFRRRAPSDYYKSEHWIPDGHEFVAREVVDALDRVGLLRPSRAEVGHADQAAE